MMLLPKLKQKINVILRSKEFWVLIIILGVGAYLRLWHIGSLFNAMEEYDEATLTLQARSIASGFLPYKDFLMVHPPFYYLLLAGIFKVFGYSLFYARYFSVLLSLSSIILIYLAGKKLYHAGAGLVAACLAASGRSEVRRIYHVERGYDNLELKLQAVGAAIEKVPE